MSQSAMTVWQHAAKWNSAIIHFILFFMYVVFPTVTCQNVFIVLYCLSHFIFLSLQSDFLMPSLTLSLWASHFFAVFKVQSIKSSHIHTLNHTYTKVDTHGEASQLQGTDLPLWAGIQLNHPVSAAVIDQPIRQVDKKNITLINKNLKVYYNWSI